MPIKVAIILIGKMMNHWKGTPFSENSRARPALLQRSKKSPPHKSLNAGSAAEPADRSKKGDRRFFGGCDMPNKIEDIARHGRYG